MRRDVLVCLVLALATFAVYLPALRNGFVYYDDDGYVLDNFHVRGGLSWEGVRWAFTTTTKSNWHPLTWLSHMADCQMFGLKAAYHHAISLLLHAASAVLLYVVLRRMTGAVGRSAVVAALFALHPLHVESVAWVAERKDVLSTFFGMLALLAYGWYVRRPSWRRYAAVFVLLALGLMAKPMLVTLPFVLLLLDWWPLGRYEGVSGFRPVGTPAAQSWWRRVGTLVAEKVPLLALAAASSVVTVIAQSRGGAVVAQEALPFGARIANALVAYVAYLGKMVWPARLAVLYPYPAQIPLWKALGAAALLAAITLGVVWACRRRYGLVGWLWYVGTLVPVIGLIQVGSQAMADRYTYVPLVGVFMALVWGVADAAEWVFARLGRPAWKRGVLAAAAGAVVAACGAATVLQIPYWRDTETLFRQAIRVTRDNATAHNNLGFALAELGRLDEAVAEYHEALRLRPQYADAHNNLGVALAGLGRLDEAAAEYHEALRLNPQYPEAHNNLGVVLGRLGRLDEAAAECREALRLNPQYPEAHNNLGLALAGLGRLDEAAAEYREALRLRPYYAEAHNNLGVVLARLGRLDEAAAEYREALRLNPQYPEAHNNLGVALARLGRLDEAVAEFREALRLRPQYSEVHNNLGRALMGLGRWDEAISQYEEAVRAAPNAYQSYNNLAWIRATHPEERYRNGTEAVTLAERAVALTEGKDARSLHTLAAAYAEAGRFAEAVRAAEQATSLASSRGQQALADEIRMCLELYRANRPYHQPRDPG